MISGGKEVLTVNVEQINADLIRQVSSVLSHHDIHGISSANHYQQHASTNIIPNSHLSTSISIASGAAASGTASAAAAYGPTAASGGSSSAAANSLLLMNTNASTNQAPFSLPSHTSRR